MRALILSQKWIVVTVVLVAFMYNGSACSQNKYDVVIYGGTAAGFSAAIQTARLGKIVVLIEPGRHIGGNIIEGLGSSDIDNHKEFQNSLAVGGLALEFYKRIAVAYGRQEAFDVDHKTIYVAVKPAKPVVSINKTNFCMADTIRLTTVPQPGLTYRWTGPDNFVSDSASAVIPVKNSAIGGVYTLTAYQLYCASDTSNAVIRSGETGGGILYHTGASA